MLWIVLGIILAYCIVGSLTGGYIHERNSHKCGWDTGESFAVGAFWPISWVWYIILKPITRSGKWVAEAQERRRDRLQRIREELEAVERTRQLEIQKHMRELEEEEAEYQARHQASA